MKVSIGSMRVWGAMTSNILLAHADNSHQICFSFCCLLWCSVIYKLIQEIIKHLVLCFYTCGPTKCHFLVSANKTCLSLTFNPGAQLHVQTSCHGWHRYGHTGPHWMSLCLHDYYNLGSVERNLMEHQCQGPDAAGFTQSWGLMVGVWIRERGPGQCLHRGGMRCGGSRQWFTGCIPHVIW